MSASPLPPIAAAEATVEATVAPLSFAQERMWLLDRMDPGKTVYSVPLALRLRGELDGDALRRALDALSARHESLHTVIQLVDGEAMQVIAPDAGLPLRIADLSDVPEHEREAEVRRMLRAESARPFDLERGPLARARLYRLEARDHVLLVHLHHVITDGWSNGVLLGELSALYGAFARGLPSPLADPELQYADYAEWQRERLSGAALERELAYWRQALAGAPALLELPTDRPRPPVQSGRGGMERFHLPNDLADAVDALARAEGATPFMVLLAAFQALLAAYSGQNDVIVGTPIANRTRPETRGVVGCFVNTLALRGDLRGDPTFRALLGRVRETVLDAFAHQEMPFERLVDELKVPRSAAHTPVFQAMFILQNTPDSGLSLPGLEAEGVEVDGGHAPFDLTLGLRARGGVLHAALEYDATLFDAETARRMVAHYRTLLRTACATPGARLSALPLMDAEETARALALWEGPALASPPATIHARVAAQARRTPDAVAIDGVAGAWTYAELDARANRLARRLRAAGVRPGVLVGVRAERSPETVAALLAVLKAGGAYLPLDPAYPAERQGYMLADSGAPILLDGTGGGAPEGFGGRVLALAAEMEAAAGESAEALEDAADPRDLAYVIYTSGSTGRPKGVMVSHRALSAYVDAAREAYAMTGADRFLQFAPLSFDASVEELFAPLACGAAMVLRDDAMLASPDAFWRACRDRRLTIASLPTAYWHELAGALERAPIEAPPALRVMIVGGDRALPERVAAWRRAMGGAVRLLNSYGPTETTVAATLHEVDGDGESVPIGRPLANVRVRVLDGGLRPLPPGVPGELFVGGSGVARGYLGRPGATAERFVPDPFGREPGARLYATGDRALWRDDGTLEFLGRADDQVKVRGFRVELGEIESLLRRLPGVREAVLDAREAVSGDVRLVAYVVPEAGVALPTLDPRRESAPSPARLGSPPLPYRERLDSPAPASSEALRDAWRDALRHELPAYMVPSAFVTLDALPLSPSGKVDRAALPAPGVSEATRAPAAPLSSAEYRVAAIWREVLGAGEVGPEDNFFDLGGNSLLLIRLAGRLADELGSRDTAVDLFRYPTVRAQAAHLVGAGPSAEAAGGADGPGDGRAERQRAGQVRLQSLRSMKRVGAG
ncbi:MAG TPA: amino acid adenylation domain-containing protein [Longimicrobium sp.]|jgi:amino acid adenylation domain-containing protein|nr:amino acid adenylation domain-containing protein [Longimicrobium sp.]